MTRVARTVGLAVVFGLVIGITPPLLAGQTYDLVFDNAGVHVPPATEPLVGTGTVTLGSDPGAGTFLLDSLDEFTMSFNLSGDTYTQADIVTTISTIEVVITNVGNGEEDLNFSNVDVFGDGPDRGAIDFQNSLGQQLSFSPPGSGADYLYYETGLDFFGVYSSPLPTIAAVTPSNLVISCSGAVFLGLMSIRRILLASRARRQGEQLV